MQQRMEYQPGFPADEHCWRTELDVLIHVLLHGANVGHRTMIIVWRIQRHDYWLGVHAHDQGCQARRLKLHFARLSGTRLPPTCLVPTPDLMNTPDAFDEP